MAKQSNCVRSHFALRLKLKQYSTHNIQQAWVLFIKNWLSIKRKSAFRVWTLIRFEIKT